MNITVKITPQDGKWQTACEMIQAIAANNPGGELNFIIEDVFSANTSKVSANNVLNGCELQRNAHCPTLQFAGSPS